MIKKKQYNSFLTAISRKSLPSPTKWLFKNKYLFSDKILDYGCGKCHEINNKYFPCDGYDPYYRPDGIIVGLSYKTIICNFVLNTIPFYQERKDLVRKMQNILHPYGCIYISVRNDIKKLNGWTSRSTWQGNIKPERHMELFAITPHWKMYRVLKYDEWCERNKNVVNIN